MGQRLNIEIENNDRTLANAYYHWSAYTGSAAALTKEILDAYDDLRAIGDLAAAVELLQVTGAGITEKERNEIKGDPAFNNIKFNDCVDRNNGILSVTEKGIEETRNWDEGRVIINIDEETVDSGVYIGIDSNEYEDYFDSLDYIKSIKVLDFDFSKIPFSEFDNFMNIISDNDIGIMDSEGTIFEWIQ